MTSSSQPRTDLPPGKVSGSPYHNSISPRDYFLLALLASAASVTAFLYFYFCGQILLYGDAVAHINIARRVFDSRTPGPLQLGTVWLPLPHVLMLPFIVSDWAWRTGVGGSIVSMVAYVAGALGIARLFWRGSLFSVAAGSPETKLAGWAAALVYGLNPNLLYLQATAMTESLSLALTIWAVVFYTEFALALNQGTASKKSLERCAMVLAAGMLTRYDHWMLAVFVLALVSWSLLVQHRSMPNQALAAGLRRSYVRFLLLCAAVPIFWLAYNYGVFQNALEFANGPYSAHAIAERTTRAGDPPHPGYHNLTLATLYFFKSAKMNMGERRWLGAVLLIAALGACLLARQRRWSLLVLLGLPLMFYPLSVAYGGVPIFIPAWYPFSYYNVRYGLQLLPLVAVCCGAALWTVRSVKLIQLRLPAQLFIAFIILGSYFQAWKTSPICLREAQVNSTDRMAFEIPLAEKLDELPPNATLLMYTGERVGALQGAGVHLARTINESNHPEWEQALARPAQRADFLVAIDGDAVSQAARLHPDGLVPITTVLAGRQHAVIYKCNRPRK